MEPSPILKYDHDTGRVAVRSVYPEDAWNAYFVGDRKDLAFRDEEGLALLKERSPLYSADRIVRPLLIGQGANDPRVNQAESDQIVGAMKAKGIPVTYILFPDEGHGFAKPANSIAFNGVFARRVGAVPQSSTTRCFSGMSAPSSCALPSST